MLNAYYAHTVSLNVYHSPASILQIYFALEGLTVWLNATMALPPRCKFTAPHTDGLNVCLATKTVLSFYYAQTVKLNF